MTPLSSQISQDAQMRKLWQAVEQCANTIVITDLSGNIEYANPSFLKLTGYTIEEIKGQNPRILKSGKTPESTFKQMWETISSGKQWHGEVLNRRKDGSLYWGSLTISPVRDAEAKVIAYIGSEEDITEQKSLLEQLQHSNADLIHAVAEIKQFSSMLSHDLKAPLSTVKITLSLLHELLANNPDPKISQLLTSSMRSSEQMLNLITDMTLFTKIGVSKDTFEEADLNHVLARALENLEGRLSKTKATVSSESLPTLKVNKGLFVILFQNLIENGIKYNENQSPHVKISVEKEAEHVILRFEDNGIGIAPENISRLFLPFSRLNNKSKFDGTGLGLAGCRKICDLHNAKIWVEPTIGSGACFCISIPVTS